MQPVIVMVSYSSHIVYLCTICENAHQCVPIMVSYSSPIAMQTCIRCVLVCASYGFTFIPRCNALNQCVSKNECTLIPIALYRTSTGSAQCAHISLGALKTNFNPVNALSVQCLLSRYGWSPFPADVSLPSPNSGNSGSLSVM